MLTASLSDTDVFNYFESMVNKNITVALTTNGTKYLYQLWIKHSRLMQFFSVDYFSIGTSFSSFALSASIGSLCSSSRCIKL